MPYNASNSKFKDTLQVRLTIRHLKRHGRERGKATEATRLEAGLAGLKVGDRAVAALDEADLFPEKYKTRCTRI